MLSVFQTLHPNQRRSLLVLFVTGLLFWASLTTLLPTLSLYISETGASDWEVGVVMGGFAIGLLLFRPWLGRLADRRDRKIVLLIGLASVALSPLAYLTTQAIPLLILIRALHGISVAAFTTGFSALVADISPPESRGEIIGYMTLVNPLGVAIGPALGGFLQAGMGYAALFSVSAGLGLVGIGCIQGLRSPTVAPVLPTANPANSPSLPAKKMPFWRLLFSDRLRIPALVLSLIGIAFGTLAIFVPLYIKERGVDLNPGLFYTAAAIASFSARIAVGRASDRLGRGRFISGSLLVYGAAMVLLSIAQTAPEFLLAGFLEGAGGGVFIPMMITLAADRSAPHERGRIFGLALAGFDLGMALAGPICGYLTAGIGYSGIFAVAGILSFAAFLIFITLSSKTLAYSLKFALGSGRDLYAVSSGTSH